MQSTHTVGFNVCVVFIICSENSFLGFIRLMVREGQRGGGLAARIQTSHSVSVEALFGPGNHAEERGPTEGIQVRARRRISSYLVYKLQG